MLTLERLRRKIQSAEDLHAIVKTMKTLAAINVRHYEEAVEAVSGYYRTIEMGLQVVLQKGEGEVVSKISGKEKTAGCGGFNSQITSYALESMYSKSIAHERYVLLCVGVRAADLIEERGHPVEEIFPVPASHSELVETGYKIVTALNSLEEKGKITKVILFHHKLLSSTSCKPQTAHLLPLDQEWLDALAGKKWPSHIIPTFTMERRKLFSTLVRQYIFVLLYRALAESMASENASRLSSMQTAEKNIKETVEGLNMSYRHQYQTSITEELLDIVAGFEALQSEGKQF
ncbi:MAG: F0F1 ATP synthase subunit gamma [Candidatus Kuenenia stuttgartiensis]|nr:F0F1 ATP synthase subunit gamma [Candidatus Kuenenia stuttgartiensis]